MTFIHEDSEFPQLLDIVARSTGITAALIEKDYWVTHTLWALHETGLEIWFKGGTSLSKGFGLIERFSEDLDLVIEAGSVADLPQVTNWQSQNKGPIRQRREFYAALETKLEVPGVRVEQDRSRVDKRARGADYLGHYPGRLVDQLGPALSPFVRLEVGRARVVPHVERALSSFVHDHLANNGVLQAYRDNRPRSVRCVHPLVTLFEKLDAMSRRYARDNADASAFVRHYEDAAQIVRAVGKLPDIDRAPIALAEEMVSTGDIDSLPTPDEPALLLRDPARRELIDHAYEQIAPMYWGTRLPLEDACATIRAWLAQLS